MAGNVKSQRFILLVEDDEEFRNMVAGSLQAAGYLVFQAASFREAAGQIAVKPHLMLLDIQLPDATGWDVARWLEQFTTPVPIIVMSGHTSPTKDQIQHFEPKAFLAKPFPIQDLLKLVEQYSSPV
jgi:DNA-binding response OmpR family regulator